MNGAADSFLDSLVDYAGLFPPAALKVPAAVAEYALHRSEPESWMLGRFIAPAEKLTEIAEAAEPHLVAPATWPFSVLVGARGSADAALAAVPQQAEAIREFESGRAGRVRVVSLEAPVPLMDSASMAVFVPRLLAALADAGLGGRDLFLEIPAGGEDAHVLAAIAAGPGCGRDDGGFQRVGAKLRCGGLTADDFPSCERVATVIRTAAGLDLPLKCTAGLHHPVRHRAAELDVMMHGFLNVFGAGVLAWALQPGLTDLIACVAETDPRAFSFTADYFAWRDLRVETSVVQSIRSRSLCGFGSCSFAEPRADLQVLGVL